MDAVGLLAGTGWASGVNLYGVVLLLGILGRTGMTDLPPALLRTDVLVAAAVLYAVEFVVDKVPLLDSVWDAVHTLVRPLGAAVLGAVLAGELGTISELGAGTGSGALAFVSHAVKASARAAVNTSPEPVSNSIVSLGEDGLVAGVVLLAVSYPLVALGVVTVLVAAGTAAFVLAVRALRRSWRGWRERRRTRRGGGRGPAADTAG